MYDGGLRAVWQRDDAAHVGRVDLHDGHGAVRVGHRLHHGAAVLGGGVRGRGVAHAQVVAERVQQFLPAVVLVAVLDDRPKSLRPWNLMREILQKEM